MSSARTRRLGGNQVKYVYYTILLVYAVWGLVALTYFSPLQIAKIGAVVPERLRPYVLEPVTEMPPARNLAADGLDMAQVRVQIHAGRKIRLCYRDEQGRESERIVWPITVGYMETVRHLIAWCELRQDFRSFRTDRVTAAGFLDERYPERPSALRTKWRRTLSRARTTIG